MSFNSLWFTLIVVLWVGYFILEGFDFGVGILLNVVAKNQAERRAVLTTCLLYTSDAADDTWSRLGWK